MHHINVHDPRIGVCWDGVEQGTEIVFCGVRFTPSLQGARTLLHRARDAPGL